MQIQFKIRLGETKATRVDLSPCEEEVEEEFKFSCSQAYAEEEANSFLIVFEVDYISEQKYKLHIQYQAIFYTNEKVDDSFKDSHFPKVNAPAIAYPFLRSFVSTMTLNAGYEPIILPTINFSALAKGSAEQESDVDLNDSLDTD